MHKTTDSIYWNCCVQGPSRKGVQLCIKEKIGSLWESREPTVQPRMRQNSDHAIKRRFDENQATTKRRIRDQLLRLAPKLDPGYCSRPTGVGGYMMSQTPQLRYPTRPFPSLNPPQPTVDNSDPLDRIFRNNFQPTSGQFTSSRMPRMEQPQHNMVSQSVGYWPISVMQRQTQPMAVTPHSYAPSIPNATRMLPIQGGTMAQSPGPQPLLMPASLSFAPPITNTISMASSSTMQQGAIVPSPHPPQTTDLAELDDVDFSFGDLGKVMDNLSIEPGTTFSDLIKTEPELSVSNMHPFPNTMHQPDYSIDQQRPNVNIQAPSPQQFQQVNSPAQYAANTRGMEQDIITGLFPGYDGQDNDHFPSYDLESQLPSTSQYEIEDLVED